MSGRTGTASELRTASSDGPAAAQKQDRDEAAHAAHHRGDVAPVALALVSSVVRRTEQANWRPAAVVGMGGEAPAASPLDSRHVSARRCARGRQLSSLPLDACVSVCAVADDRPAPRPDGHITSVSEQGNGTLGGAEGPSRASGDGAARPSEPGVESEPSRLPWRAPGPAGIVSSRYSLLLETGSMPTWTFTRSDPLGSVSMRPRTRRGDLEGATGTGDGGSHHERRHTVFDLAAISP
jgi:hypothetical protein